MSNHFDVMVIGLGVNGSAAAWQLSKTGTSVCGIDRYHPPHTHGSSHGQSRIIRQAYYENPLYVPLIKAAYPIWEELQTSSNKQLFLRTGGLMLGSSDTAVVQGAQHSASMHHISFENLDSSELSKRFPAFQIEKDIVGVLENEAGILFPEACIEAFLQQAAANGAELKYNEKVLNIKATKDCVYISTDKATYTAGKLIVAAGAWMKVLMQDVSLPLAVERQVLFWFRNDDPGKQSTLMPGRMPIYIWEYEKGKMFYGFPDLGEGIKIAFHHAGIEIAADELTNDVTAEEISSMKNIVQKYFGIGFTYNYSTTCLYTNTPDGHFIVDYHPLHDNIIIASPCSGHGFKFASVTGKILSQMATGKPLSFDISPFALSRFQ